jgi:hypothetical protein
VFESRGSVHTARVDARGDRGCRLQESGNVSPMVSVQVPSDAESAFCPVWASMIVSFTFAEKFWIFLASCTHK